MISSRSHDLYRLLSDGLLGSPPTESQAFTFIVDGNERTYTRGELFSAVNSIAERLPQRHGIVAILTSSQEQQVLHCLAALAAGTVPAVLTPPTPKLERRWYLTNTAHVLADMRPAVLLTDVDDLAFDSEFRPSLCALQTAEVMDEGDGDPRLIEFNTAFMQFSSGTTGVKKGVEISFDAIRSQLCEYGSAIRVANDDVIVNWLPLYHDMGFFTSLHLALAYGVHSVLLNPIDWVSQPAAYLQAVARHRGTLSWHPNFAYNFMAKRVSDRVDVDLTSLRMLVNCSEPVTHASQLAFVERFSSSGLASSVFTGCYAMAETTFAVTHGPDSLLGGLDVDGPSDDSTQTRLPMVSVGAPLGGVEISVRNESDESVPDGVVGEIWLRTPFTATRYLDEAATRQAFVDGWYRSGDLGYTKDGQLYVSGRKKDVLIVAGNNVFPEDIEAIVGEHRGFRLGRVAAFTRFDDRLQTERIVVLAESDGEADVAGAMEEMTASLGLSNTELHIVEPGWIVKSSAGKVARKPTAAKWESFLIEGGM